MAYNQEPNQIPSPAKAVENPFSFKMSIYTTYNIILAQLRTITDLKVVDLTGESNEYYQDIPHKITFSFNSKYYTITIFSATCITVSYYCTEKNYAGNRIVDRIEYLFNLLNSINDLIVYEREYEKTLPETTVKRIEKSWGFPVKKEDSTKKDSWNTIYD